MRSASAWPDGRWHYRRSLASRVAVLTTLAVGITIGVMAFTAFVVMRQQLMSSLDQSLLNRAHKATSVSALSNLTIQGVPPWWLGAADIRVIFVTADGTVTVRLGDGVLTVDDQGGGVAESDRPHVFERFYRAEESRAMPGSGLGLAIVRQVIDRHGGRIEVSEAPGGGARFAVWIPGPATAVTPG